MSPKKTPVPKKTLVAQKALLAEQKKAAKVAWKESALATEASRQRQLLVSLLTFSRAVDDADCEFQYTNTEDNEELENTLHDVIDEAKIQYEKQKQIFAAGVKKGKQFRALQSAYEKVDLQMRMVFREYYFQKHTVTKIEARIADKKNRDPVPDLSAVELQLREVSTIVTLPQGSGIGVVDEGQHDR